MITIKRGSIHDIELVVDFVSELLTELNGKIFNNKVSKKEIMKWITDEEYIFFIAYHKSIHQPVAIITITETRSIYAQGVFGIIEELYVKPDFRSQQIGTQLLHHAVSFGKTRRWMRLEVGAPDKQHWIDTFRFYQKNGFIEVGPRLKYPLQKK
jgi:GNAT superfamily N-acetyltransferase